MRQLLVPIDPHDDAQTRSAVEQAVRIHRSEPAVRIRLLRVQPRLSGHVSMFFGTRELQDMQVEEGTQDLALARRLLDTAGVPYVSTVLVGRSAETIAQAARDYGCDRIIFGAESPTLAGRVFGSVAQQVRHLLDGAGSYKVIGS
jgi:nucleotide-binding universal stress UspA family protein